jgi:class 3 adenylate cyclase/ligand-binding sensor domain-containing protein/HD superfamily phosphodiesterase
MIKFLKINILTFFLIIHTFYLIAQEKEVKGIPYIQTIHLKKYGIDNKNISIIQDNNGILFIGNSNGILEYNGNYWELIETKGLPYLTRKNNKIYAGAYNVFGELRYKQKKPAIQKAEPDAHHFPDSIGSTKALFSGENSIFLATQNRLYSIKDNTLDTLSVPPDTKFFPLSDTLIYAYNNKNGLLRLMNSPLKLKKKHEPSFFPGKIENLVEYGDSILMSFQYSKGLGILKGNQYFDFPTSADSIFKLSKITDITIHNKEIIAGTQSNGLILLSNDGKKHNHLTEQHGIFDAKINTLFIDRNENLWALHDDGLSRIEISTGLFYFNHRNGILGNINSLKKHKNNLYLTTSKGVYILENYESTTKDKIIYKKVSGIHSNSYELHNFNGNLMVSTEDGIYKIEGTKASLFYNKFRKQFNSVHRCKTNPNLLLIGKNDGLSVIKYINGLFIYQGAINNIPYEINSIAEDREGRIWLSAKHQGLFITEPFKNYTPDINWKQYSLQEHFKEEIKWKKLYSTSRGIYISTSAGLYIFNPEAKSVAKDTLIPDSYRDKWIFPIIEDNNQNIWYNIVSEDGKQSKTLLFFSPADGIKRELKLPLSRVKYFSINSIQPENKDIVWLGGTDGLIRMNVKKLANKKNTSHLILYQVKVNNDSIISYNYSNQYSKNKTPELSFDQNNIRFEFSATNYVSENIISYSTQLKGYDSGWSKFNHQHLKEYRNLREGEYVFRVKAKDIYGKTSNIVVFPFEIKPPVYRTWYAYVVYLIFIGFLLFLIFKLRAYYFAKEKFKLENIINERTEEVLQQKEKADNLIKRVLPKETVKELKSGRKAGPYHYNMVTVLFGDIKGFTKITEKLEELNAMDLLDKLDRYFLEFDGIVERYNIEKIKTIGDAYMCAGGIPEENHTNPVEVIVAAMEMQNAMKSIKQNSEEDKNIWDLRIGVDTGPVIAGVIGRSKVTYDIWGTTVNMASRMESSGEPGKINITGNTFMMIKDFFICKYRGKMPVKNKGDIDMYFVENLKPQFTDTLKGLKPNKNFNIQLQLLRINDLEEIILEKLEKGLPKNLFYHNVKHTIDVVTQVELIGKAENISDEELLLAKTAALFHDVGHLVSYDNHEEESVKIANRMLPDYNYSKNQIDRIGELILATKMPPKPNNLLEKILCDADLDYLGRTDFVPVAYNLYKELLVKKKIRSFEEWKKIEIDFIKKHSYFTKTARKLREVNKRKQLEKIMKEMQPKENGNL